MVRIGGTQMVSRSEIVAYKSNTEVVFLVDFSRFLFLQAQRRAVRRASTICSSGVMLAARPHQLELDGRILLYMSMENESMPATGASFSTELK